MSYKALTTSFLLTLSSATGITLAIPYSPEYLQENETDG